MRSKAYMSQINLQHGTTTDRGEQEEWKKNDVKTLLRQTDRQTDRQTERERERERARSISDVLCRPCGCGAWQHGRGEREVGSDTVDELTGRSLDVGRRRERESGKSVDALHERDARAGSQRYHERVEELHLAS